MRSFRMITVGLLLGVSSVALAQDQTGSTDASFGAEVSTRAKAQRMSQDRKGLGADVSVQARAKAAANRDHSREQEETADGSESDRNGQTSSRSIGSQVKALAEGQRDGDTKGIGKQVRALTPAATKSQRQTATSPRSSVAAGARTQAEAVANARGANQQIRAGAGAVADLRSSVANSRSAVAATRTEVSAARQTAASARADANAARENAKAAAEQARSIRDVVKAARPGRGR